MDTHQSSASVQAIADKLLHCLLEACDDGVGSQLAGYRLRKTPNPP